MPYINQATRDVIQPPADVVGAGQLNYAFTKQALRYLYLEGESYQTYNDIIGALESCKLEFYRRAVAPYEDKKIQENGDVY